MTLLKIDPEKDPQFLSLSVLLFHHLNLLNIVFRNRWLLGKKMTEGYLDWFRSVLRPWIDEDPRVEALFAEVKRTDYIMGHAFFGWLEQAGSDGRSPSLSGGLTATDPVHGCDETEHTAADEEGSPAV